MKDLLLVVLVFEHAIGRRWFVECYRAECGDAYTAADVHLRVRRIIADRIALKRTGAMRLRGASVVALPLSGAGTAIPQLQYLLVAEHGMSTKVDTEAVLAFPANNLRPPEERIAAFVQMKVDDAVAKGYRPVSLSLTVVV